MRTDDSIMYAEAAKDAGADALLVATPPYAYPTGREIALHALAIDRAVNLPVMLVLDAFVLSHTAEPVSFRVPGFRILRVLGVGGMGVVYLAEQENPRRRVALKVIRPSLATPTMLARFDHEAQALGLLQHRAIAQFYEAGSTADGRPFVVMEYVDGQPLTAWCAEEQASVERRLSLFVSVCVEAKRSKVSMVFL